MSFLKTTAIQHLNASTPAINLTSDGKVGVGNTSPAFALDVNGAIGTESTVFFRRPGYNTWYATNYLGSYYLNNGADRLVVSSSGSVTMPYQPMAQIRNNVAYSAPASHTEMIQTEVPINVGSCYSTSTGRFTAPVAGYYEVWTSIHAQPSQGNRHMLYKNGSHVIGVGGAATSSGGDWHNESILYKLYLNVNDYISIWIHSSNYCHADGNWGGWGVTLIG